MRQAYFSKNITQSATITYFLGLIAVSLLFFDYIMPWYSWCMGAIEMLAFFYFGYRLPMQYSYYNEKHFERKIFWDVVIIYTLWTLLYYGFTMSMWDTPWEQPPWCSIDSSGYFETAQWLSDCIRQGDITPWLRWAAGEGGVADLGYPIVVALLNLISNDSIIFTRIVNSFFAAGMIVLMYRLGKRNFGEQVGRLSSIFTFLMPSLIFWTATTMKEAVMTFFAVLYLERCDYVFRKEKLLLKDYSEILICAFALAWFRTALFAVAILTFFVAVLITDKKIISTGRKIALGLFMGACMVFVFWGNIESQIGELMQNREQAEHNLEYRATREDGNGLVKYLSAGMLAPLVFTVPFPTMVDLYYQPIQALQNGGWYVKNIMSFFMLYALLQLYMSKEWKKHIIVLAYLLGYLVALAISSYVHAGRFHYPILPFEMMMAAYGLMCFQRRHIKYFNLFLVFEFVVIVAWNWFKLKGRGMI